jgi:hypothetical protein
MAATFAETGDGEILVIRYDGQSAVFQVTCAECKSTALAVNTSGAAHAAPPATPGTATKSYHKQQCFLSWYSRARASVGVVAIVLYNGSVCFVS